MQDLNHIVLIGRLTQDLGNDERSFGYVGNGQARANISIAVNHSKKEGDKWVDEANYFNITIWGKTAENLKPYLTKGKQICIEGHLKQDRWEKDGQKQSRISIVADNVQLLGGKSEKEVGPDTVFNTAQEAKSAYAKQYEEQGGFKEDIPYEENGSGNPADIPF
jgi:single-strand DNA-binding protein